ncbi:hypothetical protein V6N12_020107 [Hibiscus sabdariffa]|uniref:Uncharacterized protein n=1 Tax=Hibiscus sabdariffa TaxID=183260 RepID=A0ABR1ZSS7_9ROSI
MFGRTANGREPCSKRRKCACHPERQRLTHEGGVRLPVPAHAHPTGSSSFHDIPCARHLGDQYQVEVTESVDRELLELLQSVIYSHDIGKFGGSAFGAGLNVECPRSLKQEYHLQQKGERRQ